MPLGLILGSLYVMGSLSGKVRNPPRCTLHADAVSKVNLEAAWTLVSQASVEVTAFIDVNVVPMDAERVLRHQTVLVERGRVIALGPASTVRVPAGAVRVDGRGKYLMPGLADMHTGADHAIEAPREGDEQVFASEKFVRYLAHGVTALRSLEGSSTRSMQHLQRIFAEFPVPRMYLAPEGIPGVAGLSSDSVVAVVARVKAAGYSHVINDNVSLDSFTMKAFRDGGLPLVTHSHPLSFSKVLKLGASGGSVEHLYVFWDSLLGRPGPPGQDLTEPQASVSFSMAKTPAIVAAIQRAGVWVTPTLACMIIAHPYIKGDGLAQLVKVMQDGGVKMLLGGDGWAVSRSSVHKELTALIQAGLTPYQALLTGTRNVAEYFHALDSMGTVAVGKTADLILLNGNPLLDVRHIWEPTGVMIAGRWLDRLALDQRLVAAPHFWFEELLRFQMPGAYILALEGILPYLSSPARSMEQWGELERRGQRVLALVDSLDGASRQEHRRVLSSMAVELGAIRMMMTQEEREVFDVKIQVWLRVQARQGHSMKIPGISSVP